MTTQSESILYPLEPHGKVAEIRNVISNALIITRREVHDSFRDWRILTPIIILAFLFPFLAQFIASRFLTFVSNYDAAMIGERMIPFLLMIVGFFPISISLVIALETFVGEKERRSLEPLLSTPLTNTELYIGKTLSAMIPPLLSSYAGMGVYLITLLFGDISWRPHAMLIVQIILLTTVQALVMVTGAVVVSSQTTSTRAANLLASFIIIPMTLAVQGESVIMFMAPDADSASGISALWAVIAGMFVVSILLLRVGNSIFNREELLGSTVDRLNLRGTFGKIWRYARAIDEEGTPARNIIEWYRQGIPLSLRRFQMAIKITIAVFCFAFTAGLFISQTEQWNIPLPPESEASGSIENFEQFITPENQSQAVGFIITQNVRVLVGTLLLSIFSFGVAALLIPPLTSAILGYIVGIVIGSGYSPMFIISAILPHGIIEIPVLIIATGICLAAGSVVTRPPKGTTVGHAWITTLGHGLKIILGIIIPGLIIAALIESFITPHIVVMALGG